MLQVFLVVDNLVADNLQVDSPVLGTLVVELQGIQVEDTLELGKVVLADHKVEAAVGMVVLLASLGLLLLRKNIITHMHNSC